MKNFNYLTNRGRGPKKQMKHIIAILAVCCVAVQANGQSSWSTTYFVNEWGERSSEGAKSRSVSPDKPMAWPYRDVTAQLFVQCKPRMSWIRFTESPNLTGGDIESGYDTYQLRVRVDGNTTYWRVTQKWGAKDINLPSGAKHTFAAANKFQVSLPWYEQGRVVFSWDLAGSSAAILSACK